MVDPRAPRPAAPGTARATPIGTPEPASGLRGLLPAFGTRTSVIPAAGATGPSLMFVIAVMCYLASLALGAAVGVGRTASEWSSQMSSAVTVQIKPSREVGPSDQVDAVMDVLNGADGIETARPIPRGDAAALLEPWLGAGNVPDDLPLSQLIDVTIDADAPPDFAAIAARVAAATPGAVLDTHSRWRDEIVTAARTAQSLALGVLALVAATTVAIIAFATAAGLSANRDVIEVLHLIGARDVFIAGEVQRHFLRLGLEGGGLGLALSALTFLAVDWFAVGAASLLLPVPNLTAGEYILLIAVPLAVALVTMVTARVTVLRVLGRMP